MRSVLPSRASTPGAEAPRGALAALAVAAAAFALYSATLLPGVDFGDSGSIQATVGSPLLTPRNGYPLYFALGAGLLKLTGAAPAYVMNLASAIEAAVGCGLFVLAASALTGSVAAAASGALLLAVSYTFWSQAVTAEVYGLHSCFVLASIVLALRWERQPSRPRLAAFFACYALGFGNHLSMILLLPAFALFLLASEPAGWRALCSRQTILLALAIAAAGASQYLWNLRTLWFQPDPPASLADALRTFWFDVTKSDWRDTMVLNVPQGVLRDHAAMYWFDLRQQFGIPGVALAGVGAAALWHRSRSRAMLIGIIFAVNAGFTFGYNVGDAHVFYLPSHLMIALLAACGVASIGALPGPPRQMWRAVAVLTTFVYIAARAYRDFPALDRSADTRAAQVLESFTRGLDDGHDIVLVDLNWQVANGLSYVTRSVRPQVAAARVRDVLLYAPALIRDNLEAGRDVFLTASAAAILQGSYGPLFTLQADSAPPSLSQTVSRVASGTRYVLCVLKPTRDQQLDQMDLDRALETLGVDSKSIGRGDYVAIAGLAGDPPVLVAAANRPFTRSVELAGVRTDIRMESWLSADTIRRMGFGQVVAAHRHTLIVERGVSFVAFDNRGTPTRTAYAANIFAGLPRFVIRTPLRASDAAAGSAKR